MEIRKIFSTFINGMRYFSKNELCGITSIIDEKVDNSMNDVLTEIRRMRVEMERRFQILYWVIGLLTTLVIATLTLIVTK